MTAQQPIQQSARLRRFGGIDLLYPHHCRHHPLAADEAWRGAALPGLRLSDRAGHLYSRCVDRISLPVRLSSGNDMARPVDCSARSTDLCASI
jgi:hypothetical protein